MREYNVGAVYINNNVYAGETNIPLLKGNQGYSISRVVRTSGTGTPGSCDTYTIYINTDPESIVGTFQVWNGTGNIGDMTKAEYDTDNDGIVDNAERVNNHTVDIDVPSNAKFTDTIYDDTAITNRVTSLENAGYITKSVSDLVNYYTKTETYTKQEVNTLVDTIPKFSIEVVNSLPTHDISTTTIYLVRDDSSTGDIYKEYIYVNNTWEILGTQRVDLSNYYTKSETYAKTETYNKTEVDNAIASIEGNEVIITDDSTELDDQKIWIEPNGTIPYVNSEVNIGATNVNNTPTWFKQSKNLFNKNNILSGYYIDASGSLVAAADNYVGNDFIKIDNTKTYYVSGGQNNVIRICYYTTSQTFISRELITNSGALTIPNNAMYIKISSYTSNLSTIQLEQNSTATAYEPYIRKAININGEDEYYTNDYSAAEQVIGKWINGKPIYRKVIIYGTMPTGAEDSPTVNHNIANIDFITRWYGFCVRNDGLQYNFDHVAAVNMGSNMTIATRINKQWVQIAVSTDMSSFTGYFVIEYTKTTD